MNSPVVSPQWLYDHLEDETLIILDASQQDNKAGLDADTGLRRIKGARYFDLKAFSDKSSDLPNMLPAPEAFEKEARKLGVCSNSKIVVYDNLGIYFSPRVWWMFRTMGHDAIVVLDGGLPAWMAEGFPTEEGHPVEEFTNGDFEARFKPGAVRSLKEIQENMSSQECLVIDARSEGRFKGTAPEPRAGLKSGRIPGSVNMPFERVLNGGKFKSKNELIELFKSSGIEEEERPLVFSCGSGLTACIILLAAELVTNNEKSIYDGSWTEWAQVGNLPIDRELH